VVASKGGSHGRAASAAQRKGKKVALVDGRMKKDARAMKRVAKRTGGARGGRGGGGGKRGGKR
jgi:hypothetical protein